ncbi:MAG: hypothetical protein AMXMBFR83_03740 [Phycisphaerae bacterium]
MAMTQWMGWGAVAFGAVPASAPSSAPASPLERPVRLSIDVALPDEARPGRYELRLPAGYGAGQRPALVICLHGTDDDAGQAIAFWSARRSPLPLIFAAPQGRGRGWSEADLVLVRAMLADLNGRFGYDPQRVLLIGFSAGGAMTFELLYEEGLPVTAAAALASYVPPRLTREGVAARRNVPVFYAVGMDDVNHERMRVGLDFLRSAGANVEVYRPRIGHTLDAGVAQAALDWFFVRGRRALETALENAERSSDPAAAVAVLESIVDQSRWHEPDQVERARRALERIEQPGRAELLTATNLQAAGRPADAAERLAGVEATFGPGRLGREARRLRLSLEADPAVRDELARRRTRARAEQAQALFAAAQRSVAQGRLADAADRCRRILFEYADTPAADRARNLLNTLGPGSTR